mgnify:CR=1 FL=1
MKKELEDFGKRLLSTKLITLVVFWCASNFWLIMGKITGDQWVTATLGISAAIIGANMIDRKYDIKEQASHLDLFSKDKG